MINKTVSDIRALLMSEFQLHLPNVDITEGTPERDMFIEAPIAGQLKPLWDDITYSAKLHAPVKYYNDLELDDIKAYCANYGVTPLAATYSSGTIILYTYTVPTKDIKIPSGATVATEESTPITFTIVGTYTLYANIASSYYNVDTERYEITCNVRASNPGAEYRAGSNTVTNLVTSIRGIEGCINTSAISGGQAEETVFSTLQRVVNKYEGRGLANTQGLKNFILSYAQAVNVATANDVEMVRDQGIGGAIDFYIIGSSIATQIDNYSITSTGLSMEGEYGYTDTEIILTKPPVKSITSVLVNDSPLPLDYYELQLDTGVLQLSTRALDKVVLTSSGLLNFGTFTSGDTIAVTYNYNKLLHNITNSLNSLPNHYINRDYLIREMYSVTIDVYIKFKEVTGQVFDTVASIIDVEIAQFINSVQNEGTLELADIIGVVKGFSTVDNVDLTTVSITPLNGGVKTAQGDIIFDKNEYPVSGTITLERW